MKKSMKSALLSALVFPGVGHFSLKKHVQGILLAGIAVVCLYLLVSTAIEVALDLSTKIQNGEVPLNIARIRELASQLLAESSGQLVNIATYALGTCWVVGIVDSYRVGRLQDKSENAIGKSSEPVV